MLFALLVLMLILLVSVTSVVIILLLRLLKQERKNNQRLQNFLTARDIQTLHGLNQATGVDEPTQSLVDHLTEDGFDLGETLNYEEQLARAGYQLGDLNGLEAYGWSTTPVRSDSEGTIAFDS
jgi:hypothetical protein